MKRSPKKETFTVRGDELLKKIKELILKERKFDPRISKDKLSILIKEDGIGNQCSSTVGRMINDMKNDRKERKIPRHPPRPLARAGAAGGASGACSGVSADDAGFSLSSPRSFSRLRAPTWTPRPDESMKLTSSRATINSTTATSMRRLSRKSGRAHNAFAACSGSRTISILRHVG
jgi:hypothetical protein